MKKLVRLLFSTIEIIGYITGGAPARVQVRVQRYGMYEDREQHTINLSKATGSRMSDLNLYVNIGHFMWFSRF